MNEHAKGIILIVDDSKYDRLLYKEYLGVDNFEIFEVDDGDQVLAQLQVKVPDIIILDWDMPRVGGLEVLHLLKDDPMHNMIPIIVITGREDEEVLSIAFDFGSVDFLNKPVKREELNARITNILRTQKNIIDLEKEKFEIEELKFKTQIEKDNIQKIQELEFESFQAINKNEELLIQDLEQVKTALYGFVEKSKEDILIEIQDLVTILENRIEELNDAKKT